MQPTLDDRDEDARRGGAHVLMLTNMWPHAGNPAYGIFVYRQIESLRDLGVPCRVIFVDGYRSRWAYLREAARLLALNFSRHRPTLVHAHGGETALVARCFVRGPVVVSYCGDDLLGTPGTDGRVTLSSRIRRAVLRQHARTIPATITKSKEMARALPPGVQARNQVVPNGVDRQLFRPLPRDSARSELNWMEEGHVVLFAADPAVKRKRYWLAETACRVAEQDVGPIRLQVAWGTAPDEMPRLMAACDCLLLTSAIEGSPNVVKEAMACNVPVISTAVGDVAELLATVEPSWVCSDDPQELGRAVAECLSQPVRSNGYAQSAWLGQVETAEQLRQLYAALTPGLTAVP